MSPNLQPKPSLFARRPSLLRVKVLWPVLLVCSLWLTMSLVTNAYLQWLESEYALLFEDNLQSLRITTQTESEIWRLYVAAEGPPSTLNGLSDAAQLLRKQAASLSRPEKVTAKRPRAASAALQVAVLAFVAALEDPEAAQSKSQQSREFRQHLQRLATDVSQAATTLRSVNIDWIDGRRQMLAELHGHVVLVRIFILLLGLPIGILLGWRVTRRLESTAARIAVTLNETATLDPSLGMTVQITRASSFEDVQRQAERVVERLRGVVAELQAARREVIQSERLAAVGELAAGVAHELRNPLTSIKLLLQHAARQPLDHRISEQQLKLILEEIRRMESTIQGLLDFARRPELHRIRHDLRKTIQRSLNLADGRLQQSRVVLDADLGHQPLWITGDPELLNQVFVNLLLNAIEAMPSGGQLKVAINLPHNTAAARISIADTGSGFSSDILQRLFEPFATTKEKGTGLGLAICRRIVLEHGGIIQAGNVPNGGALVRVELPLETMPTDSPAAQSSHENHYPLPHHTTPRTSPAASTS